MSDPRDKDVRLTREREAFEEAAFKQYFFSTLTRTKPGEFGPVGIHVMPKDCKDKATFLAKNADDSYCEDTLNAAWWAWQKRATAPAHPEAAQEGVMVPREPTEAMLRSAALCRDIFMIGKANLSLYQQFAEVYKAMLAAAPAQVGDADKADADRPREEPECQRNR